MIAPKIGRGTKMYVHGAARGLNRDVRADGGPRRLFRVAHNRPHEVGFPGYVIRAGARRRNGCISLLGATWGRKKDRSRERDTADDFGHLMLHICSHFVRIPVVLRGPYRAPMDLLVQAAAVVFR